MHTVLSNASTTRVGQRWHPVWTGGRSRGPRQEGGLLLISGERRIKRVQCLAGGALYLISDNDHYQPR